jgi:hypothetical protein
MRFSFRLLLQLFVAGFVTASALAQTPAAAYRARLLGVFDSQSGEPLEGVEVSDALTKTSALTTKTGTVTLSFLPEGGTLVRIRKVGYAPTTLFVAISPVDTVPLTVLLAAAVQTLPTVVTTDSAPTYRSPGLRAFEERRRAGFGHFVTEAELRKQENRTTMTNIVRQLPSLTIVCPNRGLRSGQCWAQSVRAGCPPIIYVDGIRFADNDLEKMKIPEYAGVEWYPGGSTAPAEYNMTGSSCGILLFWTRDR